MNISSARRQKRKKPLPGRLLSCVNFTSSPCGGFEKIKAAVLYALILTTP